MRDVDFILRDGTAVTIAYTIAPAECDVGIMSDYTEDWWVTHMHHKSVKPGNTCYRREIEVLMVELEIEPDWDDPADYHDWD